MDLKAVLRIPAQELNTRYKVSVSLWFVKNSQQFMNIGKMAEQALDCKSKDRGIGYTFFFFFLPSSGVNKKLNCKFKEASSNVGEAD